VSLLVIVEIVLHGLAPVLPTPVLWGQGETSAKVAVAQRMAGQIADPLDVLILGPSHASVGISPKAMQAVDDLSSWTIYNGALNGRDYPVLRFVAEFVYLPLYQPKTVVISVSPLSFNRNAVLWEANTREFMAAPMPTALASSGMAGAWYQLLVEHVNLYRYRHREARLAEGYVGGRRVLDDRGYHALNGMFDDDDREALSRPTHAYRTVWADYTVGGESFDALVELIEMARARRADVVLINMPFRRELLELPGEGSKAYQAYLKAMQDLALEHGATWLDYKGKLDLTEADFNDVDHLNEQGATKLSERLAQDLAASEAGRRG
jgi:hypothetical protein